MERRWILLLTLIISPTLQANTIEAPYTDVIVSEENQFSKRGLSWPNNQKINPKNTESSLDIFSAIKSDSAFQSSSSLNGNTNFVQTRGSQSYSKNMILLNGLPLNALDGAGANPILIPNEFITEVRTIKGPASHLYGPSALGGATNFLLNPLDKYILGTGVGSFGEKSFKAGLPILKTKENKRTIFFYQEDIDGNYEYQVPNTNEKEQRKFNNSHTLRATTVGHTKIGNGRLQDTFVFAQQTGSTPGNLAGNAGKKKYWGTLGSLDYTHTLFNWGLLSYRISNIYSEYTTSNLNEDNENRSRSNQIKNSLSLLYDTGTKFIHELTLDYTHDTYRSSFYQDEVYYDDIFTIGILEQLRLTPLWSIQLNAQYLSSYGVFTEGISLNYSSDLYSSFSFSTGYSPPSLSQTKAQSLFFVGNEDLKPEESRQVEFTVGYKSDSILKSMTTTYDVFLTTYHTYYENLIASELNSNGAFEPKNTNEAESFGLTLGGFLQYYITRFNASITQSENRDLTNKQDLKAAPNTQWVASLTQYWGPLAFTLKEIYWSSYVIGSGTTSSRKSGWTTTDFLAETSGFNWGKLQIGVDNIFDNAREISLGYPEPQRRYFARAEVWF